MTLRIQLCLPAVLAAVFLGAVSGFACSCPDLPDYALEKRVEDAKSSADAVFAAEVLSISDKGRFKAAEMSLLTFWKGDLVEKVTILTARNGAACGMDFIVGEKYLIYASLDTTYSSTPTLHAWLCSRTRVLSKQQADIPYLGKEKKIGKSSPQLKP